ncbi:MAG TPA: NAD(P)/FAD-dependent oxidoreductase [Pseudonocardiaceae bacterium]|jgi:2-polyprenyl-6-methoxyphenol hydroxylase-like FAD-dependent oxidoreductase|nr:NAD(P)/FAD-dependent oxidoreductase [Pseudonocardiaceae bacterium]
MSDQHVLVIGAGLGGLCLVQGLRKAGVSVACYERDADAIFRDQGYRIHIDETGRAALAENLPANLYELVLATGGRPRSETPVFDSRLNEIATIGKDHTQPLVVNRLTLRQILLAGIENTVSFGKQFTHYERRGSSILAHFSDGSTATGDILVAADGVNSPVRKQYLPHARIVDTGLRQLYGKIPLTEQARKLVLERMFAVFTPIIGPGRQFVGVSPVEYPEPVADAVARLAPGLRLRDSESYLMCSFGSRHELLPCSDDELRSMSGEQLQTMVLGLIADWHPRVGAMIENWDLPAVFPLTLRTSVPIDAWQPTNITLLGDAIHAMSPAGGIGANTALKDASRLVENLTDIAAGKPIEPTIAQYEADLRDYGFTAVRQSAANGHRLFGQNPLPA